MILCDREIQALLDEGQLVIDPRPPRDSPLWSSTAVDLTLHEVVLEWVLKKPPTGGPVPPIIPKSDNFDVQGMMEDPQYSKKVKIDSAHGYLLNERSFVLGFTAQKVRLPNRCRIAARVEGKSSLARLGLGIHVTAPTIHSGFGAKEANDPGSPIQLEIFNLGPWTVRLDADMPICQLIFEEVREVPTTGYGGQFSKQRAFTVPVNP